MLWLTGGTLRYIGDLLWLIVHVFRPIVHVLWLTGGTLRRTVDMLWPIVHVF